MDGVETQLFEFCCHCCLHTALQHFFLQGLWWQVVVGIK